jgi:hypothetical protein
MLFHDVTACHRETLHGYIENSNVAHELKKGYGEVLHSNLNFVHCIKGLFVDGYSHVRSFNHTLLRFSARSLGMHLKLECCCLTLRSN